MARVTLAPTPKSFNYLDKHGRVKIAVNDVDQVANPLKSVRSLAYAVSGGHDHRGFHAVRETVDNFLTGRRRLAADDQARGLAGRGQAFINPHGHVPEFGDDKRVLAAF